MPMMLIMLILMRMMTLKCAQGTMRTKVKDTRLNVLTVVSYISASF